MNIAFITWEYPPFIFGGSGIYAQYITKELANLGHTITVFTSRKDFNYGESNDDNIKIIRLGSSYPLPFKVVQLWVELPRALNAENRKTPFNVLHFNSLSYSFFRGKLLNKPHILTVHHSVKDEILNSNSNRISRIKDISGETSFILEYVENRAIEKVDKIIAVSNYTKDQLLKYYKINSDKISVVYNGINNRIAYVDKSLNQLKMLKSMLMLDNQKPIFFFVGRINDKRKGLDFLLFAFKNLIKIVDSYLIIVGSGDQNELIRLCEALRITNNVRIMGYVDDKTLAACYQLCTVYVCPSRLEGFGLTLLDAMLAGKPIVATKTGAIPEVLKDYPNSLLVNIDDIHSMTEALLTSLKMQEIKYNIKYTWENAAKDVESIYYDILK